MKPSIILLTLVFLWGCEGNTKGQNRHDPNHHESMSKVALVTGSAYGKL